MATLLPALRSVINLPAKLVWTIAAVGAGYLVFWWVLFILPDISLNVAFLVTIGVAAAVAAVWTSPDNPAPGRAAGIVSADRPRFALWVAAVATVLVLALPLVGADGTFELPARALTIRVLLVARSAWCCCAAVATPRRTARDRQLLGVALVLLVFAAALRHPGDHPDRGGPAGDRHRRPALAAPDARQGLSYSAAAAADQRTRIGRRAERPVRSRRRWRWRGRWRRRTGGRT